jgi:hypothetical protein
MTMPELTRELAHLRAHLARIAEAAAHNPECLACAEVRRLVRAGLEQPPPPIDTWRT